MSDVQDKKQKAVSGHEDESPIPVGQYTISKILGKNTVEVSSEYNSEKVYSALFEELKDKELGDYQKKYKSTNRNFDLEKRFRKILGHEDKSVSGICNDIEEKVNRMITDNYENEIPVNADKLTDCMKKTISNDSLRISWFEKHSRPSNEEGRLALYKISFAFNLSMEDHIKLFTHVFKLKPYLRTPAEFCLTYAKEHNMEYSEAVNLYYKYLKERDGNHIKESDDHHDSKTKSAENYSGTRTLMKEVLDNESDNDHEKFICELLSMRSKFCEASQKLQKRILDIAKQYGFKKSSLNNFLTLEKYCHYRWTDKETTDEKFKLFFISVDSSFKNNKDNKPIRSKTVLQLRKIYIICRTYQLWNNFENNEKKDKNNSFTGFYNTLSLELIKMNLPQLDYLDDFDRGIILATAYRLHNNTTKALGDLICEIVKE